MDKIKPTYIQGYTLEDIKSERINDALSDISKWDLEDVKNCIHEFDINEPAKEEFINDTLELISVVKHRSLISFSKHQAPSHIQRKLDAVANLLEKMPDQAKYHLDDALYFHTDGWIDTGAFSIADILTDAIKQTRCNDSSTNEKLKLRTASLGTYLVRQTTKLIRKYSVKLTLEEYIEFLHLIVSSSKIEIDLSTVSVYAKNEYRRNKMKSSAD